MTLTLVLVLLSCLLPLYSCYTVVTPATVDIYNGAGCASLSDTTQVTRGTCTPDSVYTGDGMLLTKTTLTYYGGDLTCTGTAAFSSTYTEGACIDVPSFSASFRVTTLPNYVVCDGSCSTQSAVLLTGRIDTGTISSVGITPASGNYPAGSLTNSDGSVSTYVSTGAGSVNGFVYFDSSSLQSVCTFTVQASTLGITAGACAPIAVGALPCAPTYTPTTDGSPVASFVVTCNANTATVSLEATSSNIKQ